MTVSNGGKFEGDFGSKCEGDSGLAVNLEGDSGLAVNIEGDSDHLKWALTEHIDTWSTINDSFKWGVNLSRQVYSKTENMNSFWVLLLLHRGLFISIET